MPNPTSIRFTDAENELLEVHRQRIRGLTGTEPSTTDVIRYWMREAKPHPTATGPLEAKFRRAYKAVFG